MEGNSVCSLYGAVLQVFVVFFFKGLVNKTKGKELVTSSTNISMYF